MGFWMNSASGYGCRWGSLTRILSRRWSAGVLNRSSGSFRRSELALLYDVDAGYGPRIQIDRVDTDIIALDEFGSLGGECS